MYIRTAELPSNVHAALSQDLKHYVGRRGHVSHLLRHVPVDKLSWSTPHRIAALKRAMISQDGAVRTKAVMTGWRVLLHHETEVVSAVELHSTRANGPGLSRIHAGPAAKATELAIRRAELDPAAPGYAFEPVHLMVPELFVAALWLRGDGQTGDRFRLLPPAPNGIAASESLDDDAFHAVLRAILGRTNGEV